MENGSTWHPKSVTRVLRGIRDTHIRDHHDLKLYQEAFRGFDRRAVAPLGAGIDAVALKLEDGTVLKICIRPLEPEMGSRPFDLPVIERGVAAAAGVPVDYYIQPEAQPGDHPAYKAVQKMLHAAGYWFRDPSDANVGYYRGEARLIDPWAVERLPR